MRFLKGMRRDERPTNQPPDSWRRAKNMLYNKGFRSISNEPGFVLNIKTVNGIPQTNLRKEIIGVINTGRESVLFSVEATGNGVGSEIGVLTNGSYVTIISDALLNFSIQRPIEGIFKINFNGKIIVVWWEGTQIQANPVRLLNLGALPFPLTGFALTNPADINLLELFPPAKYPIVTDIAVEEGGNLLTAAYYLILNYEYPDGNTIGWTVPYNPVHVIDDPLSNDYHNTDGAPPGSPSPKRIRADLSNVDTSYYNLQVGYVKVEGGVVTASKVSSVRITSSVMTVVINGDETLEDIPLEDVIIPRVSYPYAKTGTQLEDRLYLGNLRTRGSYDYQKYANNIKINWTIGDWISAGNSNTGNEGTYKEQKFTFFDKGFQADEVYAFYGAFINNDMTLSEAFHIPGRLPLPSELDTTQIDPVTNTYKPFDSTDAEQIAISGGNGKKFQFENSADRLGRMGFWENENERYVAGADAQVWQAGGQIPLTSFLPYPSNNDFSNQKVRHHKFPSLEMLERWGYRLNKNVKLTAGIVTPGTFTEQLAHRSDEISQTQDDANVLAYHGITQATNLFSISAPFGDFQYFKKVDDSAGSQRWRFQFSEAPAAREENNNLVNFNRSFNTYAEDYDNGETVNNCRIKFGYAQRVWLEYIPRFRFAVDGSTSTISYVWTHHRKDGTQVDIYTASTLTTAAGTLANYNDSGAPLAKFVDVLKDDYFLFFIDITSNGGVGSVLTAGTAPRYNSGIYEANTLRIETVSPIVYPVNEIISRSFVQPLGIDVSNIYIPQDIADNVQGMVIMYAKRGSNSITILGQSGLINDRWDEIAFNQTTSDRWENIRTFDFLMLKNKIPNVPTYFKAELIKATSVVRRDDAAYFTQPEYRSGIGYDVDATPLPQSQNISYNYANVTHHPVNIIRRVTAFAYVPENVIISTPVGLDNLNREEFGLVRFKPGFVNPPFSLAYTYSAGNDRRWGTTTHYFGNLKAYRAEVYSSFKNQDLVNTGKIILINGAGIYDSINNFGGDIFRTSHGYRINRPIGTTGDDEIVYDVVESPAHISIRHAVSPKEYFPHALISGSLVNTSYYDYNDDYSRINDLFALTVHDARFPKQTVFPTRIARSIVSRNEEYKISWNRFLASDYYEMPKDKGVIWKLDVANRSLMINLEFAFYIAKNKDKLSTSAGEVYTGTGDIFDRLPDEQIPIKGGYAGCQSQWAAFVSKMGYFFVDKKQGKMFLYDGKLIELSDQGLRHELFERLRDSNTVDNPFTGSGLTAGFDSEHNRLIVCKAGYIFNNATKKNDPDNFTLSYSFDIDAWISNHDYYPNLLFNNREVLLSVRNTAGSLALPTGLGEIYQHNVGTNGIFYDGTRYSSYVDVAFNSPAGLQKILDSIEWLSDVEDTGFKAIYRDKTFTHLMVYNNNQCSDIIDLRNNPNWFTKPSRNNEGVWSAGGNFRDILVSPNTPILDKDGEVFSNVLNTNPAWFDKNLFLETLGIVRFIYYNGDGLTIYLHEADAKFTPSAR